MAYIQWLDEFSVKVDAFDQDHKKLVEILNILYDGIRDRKSRENLGVILTDLVEYTIYHFDIEEKLMEKHSYPGLPAHKRIHVKLVDEIQDFKNKFEQGEVMLDVSIIDFLKDWITDHILKTDRMYSAFFNNRNVR